MKHLIRFFKYAILLVIIASAIGLVYITLPIFGNKALIVRSGSMQPTIGVGDLVVVSANQTGNYQAGEIIAFKSGKDNKTLTTHRIISQVVKDGKVFYQTRGDANDSADQVLVPQENVLGSFSFNIPKIGKLLSFTKTNSGFGLLIVLPAIFVILMEMMNIFKEVGTQKEKEAKPYSKSSSILGFRAILPFALSVLLIQSTFAYFSDTETSTNNVFEAADSFGPPIAQTLVINEFLWDSSCGNNASQEAANYWLELYNGSSETVDLKDWRFKDNDGDTIQISNAQKLLDSGEYIVISKSGSIFAGGSPCYTLQGSPEQANLGGSSDFLPATTGGVITLEKPVGETFEVVDRVQYGLSQNDGVLNAPEDQSIARIPNGTDSALGNTFDPDDFEIDSTISLGVSN